MPSILFYILKLSLALTVVYLFYQLVLRRLTFYNWNRWYLLAYTILAFLIPFINITPVLERNEWSGIRIINWVPAIIENTSLQNTNERTGLPLSAWNIMMILFISGTLFLLARLIIQFISFNQMKKKAKPFSENGLTIYQVNENIIPFSFGNSIFINPQLHNEEELREIIRHEFIHVKQKHSIDIIWGELLCLINWYNPFAWLLKRSIRQNLEFIADNKVVQNGIDKKEYQYLLLKVIGSSQYSIATQFNFSSLKKRIAMMNKTKSAKRQLLRLLFLLPATAILLLAFRNKLNESNSTFAKSERRYNNLPVSNIEIKQQEIISDTIPGDNLPGDYKEFLKRNPQVKGTNWNRDPFRIMIELKNGSKETYNLENKKEIARIEKKYGKLPAAPPLPPGSEKEVLVTTESISEVEEPAEAKEVTVTEVPAKVVNPKLAEVTVIGTPSKKALSTTGEIKEVTVAGKPLTKTIVVNPDLQEVVVPGVPSKKAISSSDEIKPITVVGKPSKVAITVNSNVVSEATVTGTTITSSDQPMIGDVDITISIKNTAKAEDLESAISKMKEKGFELKFTHKNYNNGILTELSGTVDYKGGSLSFSYTDFDQATIVVYRDGDKVNLKTFTGKKKVAL